MYYDAILGGQFFRTIDDWHAKYGMFVGVVTILL